MKLYDMALSGNCYKVRLMLALLGLEYVSTPVVLENGEHKAREFLAMNPHRPAPSGGSG